MNSSVNWVYLYCNNCQLFCLPCHPGNDLIIHCVHKHELYFLNAVQIGCSSIIICYSVINNSLTSKTVIKTVFEVKLSTVWKRCIKLVYALCCNMHVYINLCYPIAISLKIISVSSTNAILRCPSWLFMALKNYINSTSKP